MANLQRGSLGADVEALQRRLNETGAQPILVVDGVFGAHTEAAVIAFQRLHNLVADGIVEAHTRAALNLSDNDIRPSQPDIPADVTTRIRGVMQLLVSTHAFPVNGAAGIVGNLQAESGVLPNRVQGSSSATPMRARNFAGVVTDFSAEEIMNRNRATRVGPQLPGAGLAQWTSAARRTALFQHSFQGSVLGAAVLFSFEAQVDFLSHELERGFPNVNTLLRRADVSVDDACDEIAYRFEVPGVVLDANGHLLPRTDAHVQGLFAQRRPLAHNALQVFQSVPA
jgi:Putative peptidoglycan binding domain/Phage tail lysozyme